MSIKIAIFERLSGKRYAQYLEHLFASNENQIMAHLEQVNASKKRSPYQGDIDRDVAIDAFRGTSFAPEGKADHVIASYEQTLHDVKSKLEEAGMGEEFPSFRNAYRSKMMQWLRARSGAMSSHIAGRSGYNWKSHDRQMSSEERHLKEMSALREGMFRSIKEKKRIEEEKRKNTPEILRKKLARAISGQEKIKKINRIVRSKSKSETQKRNEVRVLFEDGIRPLTEKYIFEEKDGKPGYTRSDLAHGNAEIKRLEKKLEHASLFDAETRKRDALLDMTSKASTDLPFPTSISLTRLLELTPNQRATYHSMAPYLDADILERSILHRYWDGDSAFRQRARNLATFYTEHKDASLRGKIGTVALKKHWKRIDSQLRGKTEPLRDWQVPPPLSKEILQRVFYVDSMHNQPEIEEILLDHPYMSQSLRERNVPYFQFIQVKAGGKWFALRDWRMPFFEIPKAGVYLSGGRTLPSFDDPGWQWLQDEGHWYHPGVSQTYPWKRRNKETRKEA